MHERWNRARQLAECQMAQIISPSLEFARQSLRKLSLQLPQAKVAEEQPMGRRQLLLTSLYCLLYCLHECLQIQVSAKSDL